MRNVKFISNLKGFSGCTVSLYSENHTHFVRKISKSLEYNPRLKAQIDKQQFFLTNIAKGKITAPRIIKSGFLGDLLYFDMEYIQGVNLVQYIYDANTSELKEISHELGNIINIMKNSVKEEFLNPALMLNKIEDIQSSLINKNFNLDLSKLDELKILMSAINLSANTKKTFCHGDLTMENVLVDKSQKRYYLIDFLDSFIDHYWFDISKLFQDIEGKWYKFRNPEIILENMNSKMIFLNESLQNEVLKEEILYSQNHNLFLALNFARILPYASSEDMPYLMSTIEENINKFKNNID